MIEQIRVARPQFGFGTHTLLCSAGGVVTFVLQQFIRVDAFELSARVLVVLLKSLTQGASQRIAFYLPELRHADAGGVQLEGGSH